MVNYSVGKKSLAEQQYEDLLAVGNIVLQLACKSHTGSRGAQEQVNNPSVPLAWFYICELESTLLPVGSTKLFPEHPVLSFPADFQRSKKNAQRNAFLGSWHTSTRTIATS